MTKAEQLAVALRDSSPGPWRYSKTYHEVTASEPGFVEGSKEVASMSRFSKTREEAEANGELLVLAKELGPAIIAALDVLLWMANNPGCHQANMHREAVRVMEPFR